MSNYKSYKKEILEAIKEASETSLEAVGLEAQRDVTLKITGNKQVDTGRMRASVTYVAGDKKGQVTADLQGNIHSEDNPQGQLSKDTLHIGSNVKYAPKQEKTRPFLEPTVKNNMKRYSDMMQDIFTKLVGK
ncbi:hypothetical protein [Schnuerera sp.]|uniref:hypothetical protein n=1 Tax=Schnuerera sp. TaxID=2794844 RepID=UPI002B61AA19|nr:hypothetical protein [Schnuerera sp.]HSH36082.1 hypothetical protein [Schnuerera sp.]